MVNGTLSGDSQDRVPFSLSFVGNSNSFHEALFIHCEQADLIVIATHGRSGIKGMFFGSVAEKVVRLAPCPVLTVPPTPE